MYQVYAGDWWRSVLYFVSAVEMFLDHLWTTNAEVLEANPDIWDNIQDIAQRGNKLLVFISYSNLNKNNL